MQQEIRNWANTRTLAESSALFSPKTLVELRQVITSHKSVRVIGSKLTYESLTSSTRDGILLDLQNFTGLIEMTDSTAKFYAGTTINEITDTLAKRGKYLDTSPGVIGVQTIAGCLGTGTHGQGLMVCPMPDTLVAAEFMIADGSVITVDESTPMILDAARTNLGLLGIMLTVTIKISDLKVYVCNKATIDVTEFKNSFLKLQREQEFCKAWWFPGDTNLVHIWAASKASSEQVEAYKANGSNLMNINNPPKLDVLATTIEEIEARMQRDTQAISGKQFETIQRFKNAVPVVGSMQQVYMKGIPVPQINCEIAIPLELFESAVNALSKWHSETSHELHYPFIFRCTRESSALLAPHRGNAICWIGFLVYLDGYGNAAPGSFEMMREVQQVLAAFGGTPHWGKHMASGVFEFKELYTEWENFWHIVDTLDPSNKFGNEWTDELRNECCQIEPRVSDEIADLSRVFGVRQPPNLQQMAMMAQKYAQMTPQQQAQINPQSLAHIQQYHRLVAQQRQQQFRPNQPQQPMQQPQQPQPSRPPPKAARPTEKSLPPNFEQFIPESRLFMQLVELEKKLDATIQRKRLDAIDTIKRYPSQVGQLRIFLSNLAADQYVEEGNFDAHMDSIKTPSWTLRIEGRLLEGTRRLPNQSAPKFSQFVKSVLVELKRDDSGSSPDTNIIEWHKQSGSVECDGFEIKRQGDTNTPCKIFIHLANSPEKFKLAPELSRLLDIHTDTKANIINALWQYIKMNKLQDTEDRRFINCDEDMAKVFKVPRLNFPQIPEFLKTHLLPADPIVLEYIIRVDKEYHIGQYAFDVDVELPDTTPQAQLDQIPGLDRQVLANDQVIQRHLAAIAGIKLKRDFFLAFAEDPANFIKNWLASQNKDLSVILGDVVIDAENARKASFYEQPWVHEAVFRYLNEATRR